jgi:hypothetical protein
MCVHNFNFKKSTFCPRSVNICVFYKILKIKIIYQLVFVTRCGVVLQYLSTFLRNNTCSSISLNLFLSCLDYCTMGTLFVYKCISFLLATLPPLATAKNSTPILYFIGTVLPDSAWGGRITSLHTPYRKLGHIAAPTPAKTRCWNNRNVSSAWEIGLFETVQ